MMKLQMANMHLRVFMMLTDSELHIIHQNAFAVLASINRVYVGTNAQNFTLSTSSLDPTSKW